MSAKPTAKGRVFQNGLSSCASYAIFKASIAARNPPDAVQSVPRQNLTMRMQMRRFTRLTNAFSKKLDNLQAAVTLYFAWNNFCRVHQTLRVTPAMESGLTDHPWTLGNCLRFRLNFERETATYRRVGNGTKRSHQRFELQFIGRLMELSPCVAAIRALLQWVRSIYILK